MTRSRGGVGWSSIPDGAVSHANPESPWGPYDNASNERHLARREHYVGARRGGAETIECQVHGLPGAIGLRLLKHKIRSHGVDCTSPDEAPPNRDPGVRTRDRAPVLRTRSSTDVSLVRQPPNGSRLSCGAKRAGVPQPRTVTAGYQEHKWNSTLRAGARQVQALVRQQGK